MGEARVPAVIFSFSNSQLIITSSVIVGVCCGALGVPSLTGIVSNRSI